MLPSSANSFSFFSFRLLALFFAVGILPGLPVLSSNVNGQQAIAKQIAFASPIKWSKQRGVSRYRLQIARDEKFRDVFFDRLITGERHVVSGLAPGYYYWRVAPANTQTGKFLKPVRFFVSGGVLSGVKVGRTTGGRSSSVPLPFQAH